MTVGRRFAVVRVVDVIKDAKGNELDKITKRVGIIEVTQVLPQSSICKVIEGKPAHGDMLEPNESAHGPSIGLMSATLQFTTGAWSGKIDHSSLSRKRRSGGIRAWMS